MGNSHALYTPSYSISAFLVSVSQTLVWGFTMIWVLLSHIIQPSVPVIHLISPSRYRYISLHSATCIRTSIHLFFWQLIYTKLLKLLGMLFAVRRLFVHHLTIFQGNSVRRHHHFLFGHVIPARWFRHGLSLLLAP